MMVNFKFLGLLFFIVLVLQSIMGFIVYTSFETPDHRGMFGDMFGVVNTLFSGLAFSGVIYAIFLQSKELELQREELELTRKELSRSANAQEETTRAHKKTEQTISQTMIADHDRRKKQSTIEYIATIRPIWKKSRRALNNKFGTDKLSENDIDIIINEKKLLRMVRDMLGWLEHMALGANTDIYDKDVVYRMSGSNLIRIHNRLSLYIQMAQRDNPHAYIEFSELIRYFEEKRRTRPSTDGNIVQTAKVGGISQRKSSRSSDIV